MDFTASYEKGGFAWYLNLAYSMAQGEGASSAQFLWGDDTVRDYVNHNWIWLDHDQRVTGSAGVAYTWNENGKWTTKVFSDAIYGSGLRQDGPGLIPGAQAGGCSQRLQRRTYYSLNMGVAERMRLADKQYLVGRFEVVNITDNVYPLRTGTGVGVDAAQYGERRGLFGSLSYLF